jgi:hypothetical protein
LYRPGTASPVDNIAAALIQAAEGAKPGSPGESSWAPERLAAFLKGAIPGRLAAELEPFVAGMQRRIRRDADRLHDYHQRLRLESLEKLERHRRKGAEAAAPADREQQRLDAIAREYRARADDLGQRYALDVRLDWLQTLEIAARVQRLVVAVRRRKGERTIELDYNPFTRTLELPPDEHGASADKTRLVCDDALHLVGRSGLAPCPRCVRAYCRACHPKCCPRCAERRQQGKVMPANGARTE